MDAPVPTALVLAPVTDFLGDIVVRRLRKLGVEPARFSALDRARAARARLDPVLLVLDAQGQVPDDLQELIAAAKSAPHPCGVVLIGRAMPTTSGFRVWEDSALVEPFEVGSLLTLLEREWASVQSAVASSTARVRITFPNTIAALDAASGFLALFADPLETEADRLAQLQKELRAAAARLANQTPAGVPPLFDAHLVRDEGRLTCTLAPVGRRLGPPVVLRLVPATPAPPPRIEEPAPAPRPVPVERSRVAEIPVRPEPVEPEELVAPIVAEGIERSDAPLSAPAEESLEALVEEMSEEETFIEQPEPVPPEAPAPAPEPEPVEMAVDEAVPEAAPVGEAAPAEESLPEIVPLDDDTTPVAADTAPSEPVEVAPVAAPENPADDVIVSWTPPDDPAAGAESGKSVLPAEEPGFDAGKILDDDASEVAAEQPWVLEITEAMANAAAAAAPAEKPPEAIPEAAPVEAEPIEEVEPEEATADETATVADEEEAGEIPLPAGGAAAPATPTEAEEPEPSAEGSDEEPAGVAAEAPKEESGFLPSPKFDSPVRYEPEAPSGVEPSPAGEPLAPESGVPAPEPVGAAFGASGSLPAGLALLPSPAVAVPLPVAPAAPPSTGFERLARWLVFLFLLVSVGIVAWQGPEMMSGPETPAVKPTLVPILDRASGGGGNPPTPEETVKRGPAVSGPRGEPIPPPPAGGTGPTVSALSTGHAGAIKALREGLSENEMTQALVYLAKEQSVDAEAAPLLARIVEGDYPDTMKEIALWGLETSTEPAALEALLRAIREGSDRARHRAVLALHAKSDPAATKALVEVLDLAAPPATKTVAINFLATREPGSTEVLAAVARQMDASDKAIRRAAIQALGRRTEPERDSFLLSEIPQVEQDELIIDVFGALQSSTSPKTLEELQNYRNSAGTHHLSAGAVTILDTTIQVLTARISSSGTGQ